MELGQSGVPTWFTLWPTDGGFGWRPGHTFNRFASDKNIQGVDRESADDEGSEEDFGEHDDKKCREGK